jgi:putative membrane protein
MREKLAILGLLGGLLLIKLPARQLTQLSPNDLDFIEYAGETDLLAVRLGQMAQQRAISGDVRKFGRMMDEEHTESLKTLSMFANKAGGVAPNTLDDVHANAFKRISKIKAKSFDHQFLKLVVNQHENALIAYKREVDHGSNQDLQFYAREALPKLEQHLKEAKELASAAK